MMKNTKLGSLFQIRPSVEVDWPEESCLTQHPWVSRDHAVSGEDMEAATPKSIAWPDWGGEQDEVVPEDPAEVVEAQRPEQVDVNSDPTTPGVQTTGHRYVGADGDVEWN